MPYTAVGALGCPCHHKAVNKLSCNILLQDACYAASMVCYNCKARMLNQRAQLSYIFCKLLSI